MNRDFFWTFCLCAPANLCMLDCAPAKPHQTLVKQICIRWWNNRNATKFEMSLYVFVFVYEVFCQRVCSSFFLKVAFFRALLEFIYLLVVFMAKISFTSCKDPVFRMSLYGWHKCITMKRISFISSHTTIRITPWNILHSKNDPLSELCLILAVLEYCYCRIWPIRSESSINGRGAYAPIVFLINFSVGSFLWDRGSTLLLIDVVCYLFLLSSSYK
jgi:hypothetical protein